MLPPLHDGRLDIAMPFDLVLRGGVLVESTRLLNVDLALLDGRIAAHLKRGEAAAAAREMDVAGRYLLPGLVDAHAHLREPGLTQKEDFVTGTKAAAAGGVTTVLVMPTDEPWTDTPELLRAKMALAEGRTHVDLAFQVAVRKGATDFPAMRDAGAVSFEAFTADVPAEYRHETLDDLARSLEALAPLGVVIGVPPGDQSLLSPDPVQIGHPEASIEWYTASRPPLAEAAGIARTILAAATHGGRIHIRQSNSALGMETARRLKHLADLSIETTVQCLFFTAEDYQTDGITLKASPPFRTESDRRALIEAVRDGTIDIVATDHATHSPAEKLAAVARFADLPGGMAGLQTLLPAMLALVDRGDLALQDVVRVCARNPADRFGFTGRKGSLMPGHDADILVLDPSTFSTITHEQQHSKAGRTPFAGLSVPYRLEQVFLGGRIIYADGIVTSSPCGSVLRPNYASL